MRRFSRPRVRRSLFQLASWSLTLATTAFSLLAPPASAATGPGSSQDIVRVRQAAGDEAPEARGALTITRDGEVWRAEMAGMAVDVESSHCTLAFEIPGRGAFRGRLETGGPIVGHWMQVGAVGTAIPIRLVLVGKQRWRSQGVLSVDDRTEIPNPDTGSAPRP